MVDGHHQQKGFPVSYSCQLMPWSPGLQVSFPNCGWLEAFDLIIPYSKVKEALAGYPKMFLRIVKNQEELNMNTRTMLSETGGKGILVI